MNLLSMTIDQLSLICCIMHHFIIKFVSFLINLGLDLPPLQLCLIDNQWAFTCESFAQRISALEQLNDRMREFEQKLEDTQPAADAPIQATPPYPRPAKNCCALSELVHGRLVYEFPNTSACPLHQDISLHTYNQSCIISGMTIKWLYNHIVHVYITDQLYTSPNCLPFFVGVLHACICSSFWVWFSANFKNTVL